MKDRCKCGHRHREYVGDLGENGDEEGYDIIMECTICDCERFEVQK